MGPSPPAVALPKHLYTTLRCHPTPFLPHLEERLAHILAFHCYNKLLRIFLSRRHPSPPPRIDVTRRERLFHMAMVALLYDSRTPRATVLVVTPAAVMQRISQLQYGSKNRWQQKPRDRLPK
jgi:hypothetical protein